MKVSKSYQEEMRPWPGLEKFSRTIKLSEKNLDVFCYDSRDTKKPGLVMLHGLGDEADTWRHVFLPLSESFRVIAMDLPGFGRSDKPDIAFTPRLFMETITLCLEVLDIHHAIMMGNSLGGILSHALAIKYPEMIQGLILVDGALLQLSAVRDAALILMRLPIIGEWFYTRLRKNPGSAYNSLRSVYHDLDSLPQSDRDFLYYRVNQRVWSNGQRRAYFSTLRNLSPWVRDYQADLPTRLASLQTPTLVIRGESDNLFPEENGKGVSEVQPNASLFTVEEAKHLPHQEQPERFLSIIGPWLHAFSNKN